MYIYMFTIVVQTAWPNELKFVEGTHGFPGSNKNKKSTFFLQIPKKLYKCIYFACLSVCLYVSFKRKNGWTDRAQQILTYIQEKDFNNYFDYFLKSVNAIFCLGIQEKGRGERMRLPWSLS